jgi:hypothetical protein
MTNGTPRKSAISEYLAEQFAPMVPRALKRLDEGLDAVKVKVLQHEGEIVLGPEQADYTERREAAKEVLKLGDYYPDRLDVHVGGDGLQVILQGLDAGRI